MKPSYSSTPEPVGTSLAQIAGWLTGRVVDCQVGVFLSYVTTLGHGLIDRELYVPDEWCQDAARRRAAHIPEALTFATQPDLALRMVQRAQAAGLPIRWVVAD